MARREKGTGNLVQRGDDRWLIRVDYGFHGSTGARDRRSVVFRGTRKDAQKRMNELLQQRDAGVVLSPDKVTVDEWLHGWLARHFADGHITEEVRARYAGIISKHVNPHIGGRRVRDVRTQHILDLKQLWLATLKPATVYKQLVILSRAFEEAVAADIVSRNPVAAVPRPSLQRREERRALTESEVALLLSAASGTRYATMIRFALATGLREGELFALKWTEIDLAAGVLTIAGTKTRNSRRKVEVSAATVEMLRVHRASQRATRIRLGPAWQACGLMFPSEVGTPLLKAPFYRGYRSVLRRSGIEKVETVTWHTLRHTAASLWILHGADVFTVSRRLGHASASFTMDTYAHLLRGQQRVAAESLDLLLRG